MNLSFRILGALSLAAVVIFGAGCPSSSCPGGCPSGQTCDSATATCVVAGGLCVQDADCSGATPKCETSLNICVACLADTDCPGQRCDTSTFTCVAVGCRREEDCQSTPDKPRCSAEGQCVACLVSSDCAPENGVRRTCDVGTHQCVQNPCKSDSDCMLDPSGANICDTTSGGCVGCLADSDCTQSADKPHCTMDTKQCVACVTDADCDASIGQTCTTDTHVCKVTRCVFDGACDGAQRCDVNAGSCVACKASTDCVFGGTCMAQACVQPSSCTADSDCVFGTFCVGGACAACRTDADCRTGQTCSAGTCQQPATCQDSSVCNAGSSCQNGTCAPATCTADPGEPNDLPNNATPIAASSSVQLHATICPNDVDDYVVTFPEGSGATFTVKTDAAAQPLSLDLYAAPGSPPLHVAGKSTVQGVLTASINSAPSGSKALLVRVAGGAGTAVPYELDADVEVGGICQNDSREPDGSIAQAPVVQPGSYQGTLCPNDQDWLALDVPENNRLTATLKSTAAGAAVALEIRTLVNGQPVLDHYGTTDGFGNVTVTSNSVAPAGGQRYWVQIVNTVPVTATYTVNVATIPQAPPNDTCANATRLTLPQATVDGHLQGSRHDGTASCGGAGGDVFYLLQLSQPSKVEIDLTAGFPAVLSLASQCNGSGEIGCATSSTGGQSLKFDALRSSYLVRVASVQPGMEGDYTLQVQATPADPSLSSGCSQPLPLTFSDNAASVSGNIALSTDSVTSACGQPGGDAEYAFSLTADQKVHAVLTGFPGAGLSLVPANACAMLVGGRCVAVDASGTAVFDQSLVQAGDWVFIVDGGSQVSGHFSLSASLLAPVYPPPNDTCASPTDISAGGTVSGDTRGANDDFTAQCGGGGHSGDVVYSFVVPSGGPDLQETLQVDSDFDASLSVTTDPCGTGTVLACENGKHPRVVLPDLAPGTYYVWVDGYTTDSGTFNLTSSSVPAAPPPTNETCDTATVVDLSSGSADVSGSTLRASDDVHPSCDPPGQMPLQLAGPDVVYSVTIPMGKTLAATLTPTDFDGALYLVDACSAAMCVTGSDLSLQVGGTESIQLANASSSDRTVFVVVDSYESAARGSFTLHLALQ